MKLTYLFVLSFMLVLPSSVQAAWVYFPPSVSRIYASDISTYNVFTSPSGTMVFNPSTKTFSDILALPAANQPALNPEMLGLPTVTYGGSLAAAPNETLIADSFTTTAPWILWAYLTGWLVALPLSLCLNFVRGRFNPV